MPHRRCRKTTAIFLCLVMTLFWCQGMVCPVNGELGTNTFEIVDIEVLDAVQVVDLSIMETDDSPAMEETATKQGKAALSDELAVSEDEQMIVAPVIQVTQEELELLARVIHAEARGEDFEGQVAVGAVVLNRVEDQRFPHTIYDVVYQPGAFTAVLDKQIHLAPNQSAYRAAEAALNGEDPTGGAIYYYNPRTATDRWIKTRPVVKTIGNHTFSI